MSLLLIFTVAILDKVLIEIGITGDVGRAAFHLVSNLLVGFAALEIVRRRAQQQRQEAEEDTLLTKVSGEETTAVAAH